MMVALQVVRRKMVGLVKVPSVRNPSVDNLKTSVGMEFMNMKRENVVMTETCSTVMVVALLVSFRLILTVILLK